MNKDQPNKLICQSCGMPVEKPQDFGTNTNGSKNNEYCRYCYQGGKFTSKMSMPEYIEKQVKIAVERLGMSEVKAREMAQNTIPNLGRWKK